MAISKSLPENISFPAKPYAFTFPSNATALLVIDMQRDFLLENGFGHIQGGNLTNVQAAIKPTVKLLEIWRNLGLHVVHTREGHLPDLSDCPSSKLVRQAAAPGNKQHVQVIGDKGPMGRLLVRGEYGHDFVDELQPYESEIVVDKPGKGAFYNTRLMEILKKNGITHLIIGGVTTECCVTTTLREANDRGFECCALTEITDGYNPPYKTASLDMVYWSQGLFGYVGSMDPLIEALKSYSSGPSAAMSEKPKSDTTYGYVSSDGSEVKSPPQTPPAWDESLLIDDLQRAYKAGVSPIAVLEAVYDKIEEYSKIDPAVFIHLVERKVAFARAEELLKKYPNRHNLPPLWGVPFSVKDSIDVAGVPTTTACPPLAFVPTRSAAVYDKVIAQGAIHIGKTNLDQYATGLNGTRTPYGIPRSVFNKEYISGGSSSGSAVSVGAKLVSFSLATDTAGSGRVPALFNGVVGFKPTRGTVSFMGVTPACLSLDCCSFMTSNTKDARTVWSLVEGYDAADRYAKATPPILRSVDAHFTKFKFGIPPPEALSVCTFTFRQMFNDTVKKLQEIGGQLVPVDWTPFDNAGKLLYDGTFVIERLASLPDDFLEKNREALHPVIRELFEQVVERKSSAVDVFRDLHKQALYIRQMMDIFSPSGISVLVVPTAPLHPTVDQMLAEPISLNSTLGTFTHFGNVNDLCAVAVPAGTYTPPVAEKTEDAGKATLPFGVTFLGGSRTESEVLDIASKFEAYMKQLSA
ncbi:Amidase [Dactylellina cionopaga]|nr:Amidase [Dactylellina cionopaga]